MTFNKTIATIMGNAESATILDNIYFWVDKNKANEKINEQVLTLF